MNNATPYHFGHHKIARRPQAKGATSTVGRFCILVETPQGCRGNTEIQKEIRTDRPIADGFLRCTFLPKQETAQTVQACRKIAKTERDFYQSLSQLASHYNIQPMQSRQYGYPYNIALALDDMRRQLKDKISNWQQLSFLQDSRGVYLETTECYIMGTTLYYVPIIPLFRLMQDRKRKHTAQLLLSVYAYLYHVVAIPYHGHENSYLYWIYEMLTDWVTDDDETEERNELLQEIKQATYIGTFIERKLYSYQNLYRLKQRLDNFKIKDDTEKECWAIANSLFQLLEQYPNETMFRNAPIVTISDSDFDDDFEVDTDQIVGLAKCVSFCADSKGKLFDQLFEAVNSEFQNCATVEEPTISKRFDGKNITFKNLDFESRLFPLIEQLIYIVNNI